jgi:hypothetical protein
MKFDKLVERTLWLVDSASGSHKEIFIELGAPQWKTPSLEAVCPVYIRGLMLRPLDILGSDLLNALECALDFVKVELKNLPPGNVVQWPGGEPYFD